MHGNQKLCRIFLGKCTVARYKFLTTKKPPSFATRGLFVWLKFIRLLELYRFQQLYLLASLQVAFEPGFLIFPK